MCLLQIEQILVAYGPPPKKKIPTAIMLLYRNMKVNICSPDEDAVFFDIVAGVLQGDTSTPYLVYNLVDRSNKRKWLYAKKKC